jgi:forespore regulator of the sigma-K checkpoint
MKPIFEKLSYFVLLISVLTLCTVLILSFQTNSVTNGESSEEQKAYEVTGPLTVEVKLKRTYLDGEVSEEIVEETIWAMEDFWNHYRDAGWQLIDQNEEQIVFQKTMDDISPLLKTNGYFGLTEDGVLSIFNGKPGSSNVIQSFFQVDTKKLESRQHDTLIKGIPIETKDHYVKVLESLQPYSLTLEDEANY